MRNRTFPEQGPDAPELSVSCLPTHRRDIVERRIFNAGGPDDEMWICPAPSSERGHGVGLCQIGAAVMAARGHDAAAILAHYFRNTTIARCY